MDTGIPMPDAPTTLGEFILMEMKKRDMSARKFAELVGVNHRTINKFLEHGSKDVGGASPEFLMQLAKATNTNVLTLMVLTYPEMEQDLKQLTRLGMSAALRNQRIEQLPENMREAVDTIIFERSNAGKQNE